MKGRSIVITTVFLGMLFTMLGWNIVMGVQYQQGKIHKTYTMNWKTPSKVYESNSFFNQVEMGKTWIENVVRNFMPYYSEVLVANNRINYRMDYRLYQGIFGDSNWFVPIGKDDYDYKFEKKDHSMLVNVYRGKEKNLDKNLALTEQFFKELQQSNPQVNMSVYLCNVIDNSVLMNDTNLFIKNRQKKVEDFTKELQPFVQVDYLKYDNWDAYGKYFFKTDHHWTIFGAYEGYKDIVNMLAKNTPEVGKPRVPDQIYQVSDVSFRGSIARISAFNQLTDNIWDMEMNLPPYKITVDGKPPFDGFSKKEEYLKGDYDRNVFSNAYAEYFHTDVGEISFDFGHNTGRNLLAFVDSFSNCIDPMIASHYDKTYLIDLRYAPFDKEQFDYQKFVQDHKIDDVLFIMYSNSIYDNNPGNFKDKILK